MQCFWQSFARTSCNHLGRTANLLFKARSPAYRPSNILRALNNPDRSVNTSPLPTYQPLSFLDQPTSLPTSKWAINAPSHSPSNSQIALSATRSVHAFFNNHALEDALMTVSSIRLASLPPNAKLDPQSWAAVRKSRIHFPRGVSPRLPAHALLHGLVRIGMAQQASSLAAGMMKTGIRVRGKTLEKIVDGLVKTSAVGNGAGNAHGTRLKDRMRTLLHSPHVLALRPSMTDNPNVASALRLLHTARQSRSQRTEAMFDMLITLCLINGEIIIASLLFGALVKDWSVRSQALTRITSPSTSEEPQVAPHPGDLKSVSRYHFDTTPRPLPGALKTIVMQIDKEFSRATRQTLDTLEFQESLQALAYLATLLDDRQIPFPRLGSLIRTMARCPVSDNLVWISVQGQEPSSIHAYRYFHDVLRRLIDSMPTKSPQKRTVKLVRPAGLTVVEFRIPDPVHHLLPALNRSSYSALIHYALRQRFSPAMATQVYEHMIVKREPPLFKGADSSNASLRWLALFRRSDVSKQISSVLRQYIPTDPQEFDSIHADPRHWELPPALRHLSQEQFPLPATPPLKEILEDSFTLVAYLSALISSGRPHLVVQLMQLLIPIFSLDRRPLVPLSDDVAFQRLWHESVVRAVVLGPHVLAVFLNAVNKYGVTKKAHLLFRLIIAASRASKDTRIAGKDGPWHPNVVVYTTMLQTYKTEFQRCRRATGVRILNYLLRKTTFVYQLYKQNLDKNAPLQYQADARFYTALLKIMCKYLPSPKSTMGEARSYLHSVRQQYAERGHIDNRGWQPLLDEIVTDMEENGYPIPVGFQHLFVGRRGDFDNLDELPEVDKRPFAFPRTRRTGGPYTLPTYNTKGLPLRRRRTRERVRRLRAARTT